MNQTSESAAVEAQLFFLGCNRRGCVVWMSAHAQSESGAPENLAAEFARWIRTGASYRLWPVLAIRIEDRILRHYSRLPGAQRKLSARAHSRGSGRRAIRALRAGRMKD